VWTSQAGRGTSQAGKLQAEVKQGFFKGLLLKQGNCQAEVRQGFLVSSGVSSGFLVSSMVSFRVSSRFGEILAC